MSSEMIPYLRLVLRHFGSALACVAIAVAPAEAQTLLTQLLTEGQTLPGADALPGFLPVDTVRNNGFRDPNIIPNGNFAGAVTTNPGAAFGSENWYAYGSADGGVTVGALRREGVVSGQTQTAFGSPIGIDSAGRVYYRATLASAGSPDSLWRDDTLLATDGDAIPAGPLAGSFLEGFSWVYASPNGQAHWVSSYSAASGGATAGSALFRSADTFDVLLKSGDQVGGFTIEPRLLAGNMAWSQLGSNYATKVAVSPDIEIEDLVVINGQPAATVGGGVLRKGDPIPAAAGGLPNETWLPGSLVAVNEAGDWAISASARINNMGNSTDDFIVVNGAIRYRDGQIIDGHTLTSLPQSISLNDRGDLAFVWDNKVFLNDKIIAQVGDGVDTDGNGVADKTILNLFLVELSNLSSPGGDGAPLLYLEARVTGGQEVVLRNNRVTLAGDYNADGAVDAADYTVWRDTLGSQLLLDADGDRNNVVDAGDYAAWTSQFGGPPATAAIATPEPHAATLLALLLAAAACVARRPGGSVRRA